MSESSGSIRTFMNGVVAGVASILPGVSGGLILVLCGCYERLIEDISELRTKVKEELGFLATIGLGLVVGMLVCTLFLDWTLDLFAAPCMAFFFGLIAAQIPDVFRFSGAESGKDVDSRSVISFLVGLGMIVALMFISGDGRAIDTDDRSIGNMIVFGLCGMVLAVSKVMPGISGSSLLIALGLFDVTISSAAHLDMSFLIPLGIGLVIGILGFAKVMNWLLKGYRKETYILILGLTIGSLLIILKELVIMDLGIEDWVVCAVLIVAGIGCSVVLSIYGRRSGSEDR